MVEVRAERTSLGEGPWVTQCLNPPRREWGEGKTWPSAAPFAPQRSGPEAPGADLRPPRQRETEGHRQVAADTEPENRQVGYQRQT